MITPQETVGFLILGFGVLIALVGWVASAISDRQTDQLIVKEEVRINNITEAQADRLANATGLGCWGILMLMVAIGVLFYGLSVMGLPPVK